MSDYRSKILIIDKKKDFAENLKNLLINLNCHIEIVQDCKSALRLIQDHIFDLVLCDLNLTDTINHNLVEKVLQKAPRVEFILLTQKPNRKLLSYAIKSKWVVECLQKPFDNLYMKSLVTEIIKRQNLEYDLEEAEKDLKHNLELKTCLLDNMSELVMFFRNPDMKIEWANKAAAKSVNLSVKEIKGKYCYKIFRHTDEVCKDCPVSKTFKNKKPYESIIENEQNNTVLHTKSLWVKQNGMSGVMEISTDITNEINLQKYFKLELEKCGELERKDRVDRIGEKIKLNNTLDQIQKRST